MIRIFQFMGAALALTFGCSTNAQSTATLECAIYKKACIKDQGGFETCEKKNERSDHIVAVKRAGDIYSLEDITGSNELSFQSCKISAGTLYCQESTKSLEAEGSDVTRGFAIGVSDGLGSFSRITRMPKYDGRLSGRVSCRRRTDGDKLF